MAQSNSLLLVVDDNKDIRELLKHILTLNGYQVQEAAEGVTALKLINQSRPALVLLDVMMPGLSGYDVLEQVRLHPEIEVSEVPILMITAKSQIADVDLGKASGADDYLIKPFRPAALMEKITELLEIKVKDVSSK